MNWSALRVLAVGSMVIDHLAVACDGPLWMRAIGRIAFPAFMVMVVEGCKRTKNKRLYASRLIVVGLMAQPFYSALLPYSQLNILFTLAVGVLLADRLTVWRVVLVGVIGAVELQSVALFEGFLVSSVTIFIASKVPRGWGMVLIGLNVFLIHWLNNFDTFGLVFGLLAAGSLLLCVKTLRSSIVLPAWCNRGWHWYFFYPTHLAACVALSVLIG